MSPTPRKRENSGERAGRRNLPSNKAKYILGAPTVLVAKIYGSSNCGTD